MSVKDQQAELLKEIQEGGNLDTIEKIKSLIDLYIQEAREDNDDATGDQLLLNQGGVQRLKYLKSHLSFSKEG